VSNQLTPARLIPYDVTGKELEQHKTIILDFNPESLSLQVQTGEEKDRGRRGRQPTQHVGKSTATLSFDAVFDTTRPNPARGGNENATDSPEKLDVRIKTAAIANLLQAEGKGENSAPRRVRFHWGVVIFDGVIKSFSETLDYFSPDGVPLRSKVSISINEQDFRYNIDANQVKPPLLSLSVNVSGALAANNGLDSLFDLSVGAGFKLDPSLDLELRSGASLDVGIDADFTLAAELGLNADIGIDAGVDLELSAGAALDVFGSAAIDSSLGVDGGIDLGVTVNSKTLQSVVSPAAANDAARPPNTWAPAGPPPGSRAGKLAVHVQRAHANSASTSSTGSRHDRRGEKVTTPLPVRGSPPIQPARFGPVPDSGLFPQRQQVAPAAIGDKSGRPAWERLPSTEPTRGTSAARQRPCCSTQRKPHDQY
jgi:hypothetical protein